MENQFVRTLVVLFILGTLGGVPQFGLVANAHDHLYAIQVADQTDRLKRLRVTVTPDKEEYELGEKVVLQVELHNAGETPVELPPEPSFFDPSLLNVLISSNGVLYRQYIGPDRDLGGLSGKGPTLAPDARLTITKTILWNSERPRTQLSDIGQQVHEREYITTPCVFWTSGKYQIKAVFRIPGGRGSTIESAPALITVNPPTGSQRLLWEWIQTHPSGVRFLHTGRFPYIPGVDTSVQEAQMLDDLRGVLDAVHDDPRMMWVQNQLDGHDRKMVEEDKKKE